MGQGPELIPTGLQARGIFEQAISVETNEFYRYASPAIVEAIFRPRCVCSSMELLRVLVYVFRAPGVAPNAEIIKSNLKQIEITLGVYEKILARQRYLAGDEYTLADMFHIPWIHYLRNLKFDIGKGRPNVARYVVLRIDRGLQLNSF